MCLGGKLTTRSLPSTKDAMHLMLRLIYGDNPAELQTWEKLQRNAENYRRFEAGEDSVVLGRAFGLGDRRIRDIIEHERRRHSDLGGKMRGV
jgi:hypothetical protein